MYGVHVKQWQSQDLTLGGWTLSTGGGRKSLKVLKAKVKVIFFSLFWPYFY